LDGAIMSACDDPSPDGLVWGELAAALGMAIGSGLAVGLQVTIYNPDFDQTGANGRGLATTINTVLSEFVWVDDWLALLAFGDSITNGGGELQWGVALQSWALWVARGLGMEFTTYAVDGARSRHLVGAQLPAFEARSLRSRY